MKLTRLFQQSDNSSELKPGEIKEILIRTAARFLPDFKYLMYKKDITSNGSALSLAWKWPKSSASSFP